MKHAFYYLSNLRVQIKTKVRDNSLSNFLYSRLLPSDMTGIIPEEDEEDYMYDDVGNVRGNVEPAGEENDEIYEELPGLIAFPTFTNCTFILKIH